MRVVALRGVCLGPGRHLMPADNPAEVDDNTARFLIGIGAVKEAPEQEPALTKPVKSPAAAGKES